MTSLHTNPSLRGPHRRSRSVLASTTTLAVMGAVAVGGLVFSAASHEDAPGCCVSAPSSAHWLGTAENGRDLVAELLRGLGGSALIIVIATALALLFGVGYGLVAASLPRRAEGLMMRFVDVAAAIPMTLIVVTVMVSARALRPSLPSSLGFVLDSRTLVVLSVASLQWLSLARVAHARVSALGGRAFVRTARFIGASRWRVFVDHIAPHARGPLFVFGVLALPSGLVAEAFFSFLGFGVEAPHTTLGTLLGEGARAISVAPIAFLAPAALFVLTSVALQVLGARLREDLRPESR